MYARKIIIPALFVACLCLGACGGAGGILENEDPITMAPEGDDPQDEPPVEAPEDAVACSTPASPDIWFAIGQSNMQWVSQQWQGQDIPEVEVRQFHVTPDPDGGNVDEFTPIGDVDGFSWVGGAFGIELADLLGQKVQVFAAANGGTKLSCWEDGGFCRTNFVNPFINTGFKGVIWWQGESDALTYDAETVSTYEARLQGFFDSLRTDANNPELPIVIIGLEHYCAGGSIENGDCFEPQEWKDIRAAQHAVADADEFVEIVDIDSITDGSVHPTYLYDHIGGLLADKAHEFVYDACEAPVEE